MFSQITEKSIFFNKITIWLFIAFFGIKMFSYLLFGHAFIQSFLVFIFLMVFAIIFYKNAQTAFLIVIGELFIGGSGNYFEISGLSIRTLLIATFLLLWLLKIIFRNEFFNKILIDKYLIILLTAFYLYLSLSVILGIMNNHYYLHIVRDLMPFLYIPLIFPAYNLLNTQYGRENFIRLLTVFIIGSSLFSIFTFIIFSTGYSVIHGEFYTWLRDVVLGKVTDMGNGFFRIVAPEHLLITPIILLISSLLMRDERHHKMWRFLLFCGMIRFFGT